ncbi:MAG: type II toxin-antitoxin system RelE/ParE family toxin [Actinomycetota bacterium]|nr:type II toxin-antitoxin system RelE/ParE family toxin [Actinomycetota bacterium]
MYELLLKRKVEKNIARLPDAAYERIVHTVNSLVEEPRPPGCRKLRGREEWRVRVGDYRIIYGIDDERRVIEILSVAHRREAYR